MTSHYEENRTTCQMASIFTTSKRDFFMQADWGRGENQIIHLQLTQMSPRQYYKIESTHGVLSNTEKGKAARPRVFKVPNTFPSEKKL